MDAANEAAGEGWKVNMRNLGELSPETIAAMLQMAVDAAAGGHDMRPVEGGDSGHQTICRRCGMTAWVDDSGMIYSLLAYKCPDGVTDD